MRKQAAVKEVQVQMIYRFKEVARICFIVESSNGVDQYNTCFSNDAQHGNCTCPSTSPRGCYHLNQLRPLAQAYFDARKQVAPAAPHDILAAQFGAQVHKMEMAPSGRLVPMR